MKSLFPALALLAITALTSFRAVAQDDGAAAVTVVEGASGAADGLDLKAVGALFRESKDLEAFERSLNDPETGVNNLDLDGNGETDFIRVVEEVADDTHVIILQVPLGKDEFQDVATIEVEKSGDESYNLQVRGNEVVYGPDYYVVPADAHIHAWPVIAWIYRPLHRPYRSVVRFNVYPRWWRPHPVVSVKAYRVRTGRLAVGTFSVAKATRVRSVTRVRYNPRTSTLVRKTTVTGPRGGKKTDVTRTKVRKRKN